MKSKIVILFCTVLFLVQFNVPTLAMTDSPSDSPLGFETTERTPSFTRRVMQKMLSKMRRNSKTESVEEVEKQPAFASINEDVVSTPSSHSDSASVQSGSHGNAPSDRFSLDSTPLAPIEEIPADLQHTPKAAMDRILSQLDAKDLTALGLSSKQLHSRVFASVPIFKYHQLIREKCGEQESQFLLNQLHGADSSKRFAIEKRSSECLDSLSSFCKAMDQESEATQVELSPLKFSVSIHRDAFKLRKLAGCKIDLRLDYNAFETIKTPLDNLHGLRLTSLAANLRLMSVENARIIAKLISTPGNEITTLNVGVNTFEDMSAFTTIMDALKSPSNRVERLSMNTISIRNHSIDTAITAVAIVLQNENNQIKTLSLMRSKLTWLGLRAIFDSLQHPNNKLEELSLHSNEIGENGLKKLSESLSSENCYLKSLDLGENQLHNIEPEILYSFINAVVEYGQLDSLSLDANNLGPNGVMLVTPLITAPENTLRMLSMSKNRVGIEGTALIAEAMKHPSNAIEVLKWRMNDIRDIGAEHLADALKNENCKLVELDVSSNLIKNPGASALAHALTMSHVKLESLNLAKNMISSKNIVNGLHKMTESDDLSLKELDLSMNVVA